MSGFKDVVGHKNIIKYIQNAVTADAVSHAYILNGERGSGKKLLANLFAMSLQCENRDEDGDACGKCRSCRQAAGGNQPDIIRIMHEKPNTIGVGDIRTQVNDDIMIRPYSSKYKIYIIADADMMSVEAQNALLKILEEPPAYAAFLILSDRARPNLPRASRASRRSIPIWRCLTAASQRPMPTRTAHRRARPTAGTRSFRSTLHRRMPGTDSAGCSTRH